MMICPKCGGYKRDRRGKDTYCIDTPMGIFHQTSKYFFHCSVRIDKNNEATNTVWANCMKCGNIFAFITKEIKKYKKKSTKKETKTKRRHHV